MTFISKIKNMRVCVIPDIVEVHSGHVMPKKGKQIDFENYKYETNDKEEISFLKKHAGFGIDWYELSEKAAEVVKPGAKIISE